MLCVSDRSPDVDLSDDDEGQDEPEYSSNEEMSDSEPIPGEDDRSARFGKFLQGSVRPHLSRVTIATIIMTMPRAFQTSQVIVENRYHVSY